jgi:hypothetical protein
MKLFGHFGRSPRRWTIAATLAGLASIILALTVLAASAGNPSTTPGASKRAKLQAVNAKATADARSWHAPKHPSLTPITSCPVQDVQSNINVDVLPGDPDNFTNVATIAPAIGRPFVYQVYAGSAADNPEQGILVVMRRDLDPCAPTAKGNRFTRFDTPFQRGAVTLTAISGDSVAFTTAEGTTGHFNFVTGQFSA